MVQNTQSMNSVVTKYRQGIFKEMNVCELKTYSMRVKLTAKVTKQRSLTGRHGYPIQGTEFVSH